MNKDVIYIDVDDDVTAIIGKIKSAKEKIVAIVPPKRAGSLQSAVNLRLLDRMAKADKKKLVLITNNQALMALAANASIPVAKNLQSKPELASIPALAVDDGDDIIDGADIPVGEHAATVPVRDGNRDEMRSDAIDSIDIDGEKTSTALGAAALGAKKTAGKSKIKVPNFDSFRKKLFLVIAGAVGLVALLVWMFVFAPAATVIVTARTSPAPVSAAVTLSTDQETNVEEGIIRAVREEQQVEETIEFTATGQRDVGEKATGTLSVSKLTQTAEIVPAGSRFVTAAGLAFITQSAVTIPASQPCFPSFCAQSADVSVVAEESGTAYNNVTGTTTGPDSTTGTFDNPTSGGTSRIAKVVSAEDIERAQGDLIGRSTEDRKAELLAAFSDGAKPIDSSFLIDREAAVSSPARNAEAPDGKATLTIPTTYSMYAVPADDLSMFLEQSIEDQLVGDTQRVYSNGIEEAGVSNFQRDDDTLTASITTTGQIGPKVDEAALKEQVKGQIFGEVQASLESIEGIQEVDVRFSYFWVRTVPNDPNKIDIEFKLENE